MFISPFRRVLSLPSESWEEFGGGVFCHYHERNKAQTTTEEPVGCFMAAPSAVKIRPRDGDCLFSASVLLVLGAGLDWQSFNKVIAHS